MKKALSNLFLISTLMLSSTVIICCTKKETTNTSAKCYHCFSATSGVTAQRDICTNKIDTVQLRDQNGNPVNQICQEK